MQFIGFFMSREILLRVSEKKAKFENETVGLKFINTETTDYLGGCSSQTSASKA